MDVSRFFGAYFDPLNAFMWLHVFVAICAAVVFRLLAVRVDQARTKSFNANQITDDEYKRVTDPITSHEKLLDLCATGFVLIGLFGTMVKFAVALHSMNGSNTELSGFAAALGTSAFGMVWMLMLTFVMTLYHRVRIEPVLDLLRTGRASYSIPQAFAEVLGKLTSEKIDTLRKEIETLARVTTRMSEASDHFAQANLATARELGRGMQSSLATAEKLDGALARVSGLPDVLAHRMGEALAIVTTSLETSAAQFAREQERHARAAADMLRDSLTASLAKLETLPATIGQAMDDQAARYRGSLDDLSKQSVERLQALVTTVHDTSKAATERELAQYLAATSSATRASMGEVRGVVEELAKTMAGQTEAIGREMNASIGALTAALKAASQAAVESAAALRAQQQQKSSDRSFYSRYEEPRDPREPPEPRTAEDTSRRKARPAGHTAPPVRRRSGGQSWWSRLKDRLSFWKRGSAWNVTD
jgi:hypothetical protein